jgi:ubiquinone/menaquinone biosynthesis C-methylase UbiE
MQLRQLRENWEKLGERDAMWAILSRPDKKGGKWDEESFFQTGQKDVNGLLSEIAARGFALDRGTALDFGCGIGRLTQALCAHFQKCYGIDISSTMLSQAVHYNRFGSACTYVQNDASDLRCFDSDSFDFIYSHLVLQHTPPEASKQYIAEFVRVLKPGGLLIFQAPSERRQMESNAAAPARVSEPVTPPSRPGVLDRLKDFLARLADSVKPKHPDPTPREPTERLEQLIEMHGVPRTEVLQIIQAAGGNMIEVQAYNSAGPEWASFRYWVTKPRV